LRISLLLLLSHQEETLPSSTTVLPVEFLTVQMFISVVKQKGMLFGFRKTATAVTRPERQIDR